jgi:hypothetical protein
MLTQCSPGELHDQGEEPGVFNVYGKDPSGVPTQLVAPVSALQEIFVLSPTLIVVGSAVNVVTGKQEGEILHAPSLS